MPEDLAGSPAWLGNLPRVLNDLGVGVVVWDGDLPIYISPLFSDMIGYSPEELGVGVPAGIECEDPGLWHLKGGPASAFPPFEFQLLHEFEWVLIHRDGHRVAVDAAAGTIVVGGRVETIGVFCDRSEQERIEGELKTRTMQQAALVDLGQRALAGAEVPELMDQAAAILTRTLDVDCARVLEIAPDRRGFAVRAGVGWDDLPIEVGAVDLRLRSQAGYTLLSDTPVVVEDFDEETRFNGPLPKVDGWIVSGMTVAIRGPDQAWGVLAAHSSRRRRYGPQDVQFLQAVANVLAEAIVGKSVQDALRRAGDRERELREELEAHSRVVVAAQEAERRRIARELHDEIGQALTGLALSLASLERVAPPELRTALADARAGMGELVSRVHDFSLSLRPPMLDDIGLLPALLWLTEHVLSTQTGLQVDLEHEGLDRRFSWEVETAAYRIVQEALTNIVRHADSGRAHVRCLVEGEELFIEVGDEGIGFKPQSVRPHTTSGLRGMQERARLLGGGVRIDSAPGKGTRVMARLPLHSCLPGTASAALEAAEAGEPVPAGGTSAPPSAPAKTGGRTIMVAALDQNEPAAFAGTGASR
ncbi:MAG TPA: GAF domain-containing protein [Actinomycetota bacterium]|nr:GAF domain-containing protein [Actinomycetota bacterium]